WSIFLAELLEPLGISLELGAPSTDTAEKIFDERVHLPLDERLRHLEGISLYDLVDQLLANVLVGLTRPRARNPLAELVAKLCEGGAFAVLFGEIIVRGRQHLLTNSTKREIETDRLARHGGVGMLLRKIDVD